MDKTFEEIIGEVVDDFTTNEPINEMIENGEEGTTELEDNQTETIDNEVVEETNEDNGNTESEHLVQDEEVVPRTNEKDVQAFARMRIDLKKANEDLAQAKEYIDFFDTRAKQMGLNGIQGLKEKTLEAELAKEAEKQGIDVEVLKRISSLENQLNKQSAEKEELIRQQKETALNNVFEEFVQKNTLDEQSAGKIAENIFKDGFTLESLMEMPESAVSRILNAYLPNEVIKQTNLAKKEQIKKEMAIKSNASSNINMEDEIDKIAKLWASSY